MSEDIIRRVGAMETTVNDLKTDVTVIKVNVGSIKESVERGEKSRKDADAKRANRQEWIYRAALVPIIVAIVTFIMGGGLGK